MKAKAFAKINLMLKVISKEENNYHQLQMINSKIHVYDLIKIKKAKEHKIIFKKNKNISSEFLLKVINQFNNIYNIKEKYKITIIKNIPVGAGLGGGSADAAKIIDMLYIYNKIEENNENKIKLFKNLGADIPYMFYDSCAIVEGIGEKVKPIEKINLEKYIYVYPNIEVSTKKVFEENKTYSNKLAYEEIIEHLNKDVDIYSNDLEKATFELYPQMLEIKQKLSSYGKTWMSGTGSTFIIYIEKNKKEIIKKIKKDIKNITIL